MPEKHKVEITVQVDTEYTRDQVLEIITHMLTQDSTAKIRIEKGGFGNTILASPIKKEDLISIEARNFDYQEHHGIQVEREGNSIGKTFQERPEPTP